MATDTKDIPAANKRGAARLAAVQALYQMDMTGSRISDVVEEYESLRIGKEVDGDEYLEADLGWFRGIVSGVVKEQKLLDPVIHQTLPDDWPLSRIDTLLRSLLRCGAFELKNRKDVPARVVISEYLEIAKSFFEEEEPRLVNGVLDRIARKVRQEEFKDGESG
ncbi:MAG: transcription antitermination factor NusB [Pseudomonadota bacterium]